MKKVGRTNRFIWAPDVRLVWNFSAMWYRGVKLASSSFFCKCLVMPCYGIPIELAPSTLSIWLITTERGNLPAAEWTERLFRSKDWIAVDRSAHHPGAGLWEMVTLLRIKQTALMSNMEIMTRGVQSNPQGLCCFHFHETWHPCLRLYVDYSLVAGG